MLYFLRENNIYAHFMFDFQHVSIVSPMCTGYKMKMLISKNRSRQGAPSAGGEGIVTYVEPLESGATQYWAIYTISIVSP